MHISINTAEEISDLDRQVLALLGGGVSLPVVGEFVAEPEEEKPAPKKTPAKKAAAKKAKPEPDPEPEPIAEEPVEEEEVEEEEVEEDADEQSDEDLLKLAIKKATEMATSGDAAKVREALDVAGAGRVRELNTDNVREFFKALS